MSIAKMKRVTIIGTKDKEEKILKQVMKKGFLQIENMSQLADDEEFKEIFTKEEKSNEISELNQKLIKIEKAISNIKKYYKIKKSMFENKQIYKELSKKEAESEFLEAEKINKLSEIIEENENKIEQLDKKIKELQPWENAEISGNLKDINYIDMIFGTLNLKEKKIHLEEALNKEKLDYSIIEVTKDKQKVYLVITFKKESANDLKRILKKVNFEEKQIELERDKTIAQQIKELEQIKQEKQNEIEANKKVINPEKIKKLENLYDYIKSQKDLKTIMKKIVTTQNTFYLEGWMPEKCKIEANNEFIIKERKEQEGEKVPVLVQNNSIVQPFQSITNMYSVPNKNEIDPNPIMAIFYILFFGLMLSDIGYGLLLTIGCIFIWFKKKYEKGEGNLIKLLTYSGISSILWGAFFGSFFGGLIPLKGIMNPLTDVMPLMGLALALGILHIYTGMLIKAVSLIKERKIFDAICDVFLWYLLLTGVFLLVIPIVAGDIGIFAKIGKYLAIIGAIGVFLTAGRKEKNPIKKITSGLGGLYNITSYFSDVLSYSRLMALCLSTGVIAQVVNLLADLVGPIPAVIVGIIGHGFNLANSALGSYVHTSRLQYVEFFGKFYEGGGEVFSPFKYKNKYTRIREEN